MTKTPFIQPTQRDRGKGGLKQKLLPCYLVTLFHEKGFTLVEVLVFVTLISLIFITVSYIATLSLKNTKINEHKILATHYAEELKEWLRGEKERDWNQFINFINTSVTYCFNNSPIGEPSLNPYNWNNVASSQLCGDNYSLNNLFKRDLTLTYNNNNNQVTANIVVEWKEDNNTYSIPVNTVFSVWE